jgi:ABC-2 type transport system permease protein
MAEIKKRSTSLALSLTLLALNLLALNLLVAGLGTWRVDLTEERLYSISPATRRILAGLEEDVRIRGYFSRRTHPELAPLVPRIEDLLDEYAALSRGKVRIEIVDPRDDEEVEQEANDRFGVRSTPFRLASKYEAGIVNAYFAIVVQYGDQYVRYGFDDLIDVEPLPDGQLDVRLRNLEYDLTRAIKKTVYGFRTAAELFERVEGPVRLTVVMSPGTLPEVFEPVPDAVRAAAAELTQRGGEKFQYEEIDPSTGEQARLAVAQRFGAGPMSLGLFDDTQFYLYGFLEAGGRTEQLDLVGEDISAATIREAVESALRRLTPGFLKTVGVVAPRPEVPPELMMQLQMQGRMPPPEFEQIKQLLRRDYEVVDVTLGAGGGVPSAVDTLLVLKPRDLDEMALYDLDQYLMRGGRVIVCAGNFEVDFDPRGLRLQPINSGIADWLAHFGVEVTPTLVLDDRNQPLPIPEMRQTAFGTVRTWSMAPYPYLVEVRDDGLVNHEIAANLGAMGIYWGSPVVVDAESGTGLDVIEILRSSSRSWTDDDLSRVTFVDYEVPAEGLGPRLLGVALSGRFSSFFAGAEAPRPEEPNAEIPEGQVAAQSEVPLARSPETRLVVIGDAEFLSDFVARSLGMTEGGFFAENLAFMQNLIDWINLDSDLIGIRSRGAATRRLQRVETGTEALIETLNYAVPLGLLLALAGYQIWKRRSTLPLVGPPAAESPSRGKGGEA